MPRVSGRKDHPLSMRMPEADLAVIDRAATVRGRSRTDFVRDAAVRAAEAILLEERLIHMTPGGFDAFLALVSDDTRPVPEMVELSKRRAPWESDGPRTS